jgi:anti-anti-sigma factor
MTRVDTDDGSGLLDEPTIRLEERDGITVVWLAGEHDAATAPDLERALEQAGDRSSVVVSLARTDFIDSTTLHVISTTDRRMTEQGRRLVIHVSPGSVAERVVELCQLDKTLLNSTSLDEAVALADRA